MLIEIIFIILGMAAIGAGAWWLGAREARKEFKDHLSPYGALLLRNRVHQVNALRKMDVQNHCQQQEGLRQAIGAMTLRLNRIERSWENETGHPYNFGDESGDITDTQVKTGDIDQVEVASITRDAADIAHVKLTDKKGSDDAHPDQGN